jgi:Ca2+-binding EF-hand superfamily protein
MSEKIAWLSDLECAEEAFNLFDQDGSGKLEPEELQEALRLLSQIVASDSPTKPGMPIKFPWNHKKINDSISDHLLNKKGPVDLSKFSELFYGVPYVKKDSDADYKMKLLSNVAFANEAFQHFDTDQSGQIDAGEFKKVLDLVSRKNAELARGLLRPLPYKHKSILDALKKSKSALTYDEFVEIVYPDQQALPRDSNMAKKLNYFTDIVHAEKAFRMLDKDNSGALDASELKEALKLIGIQAAQNNAAQGKGPMPLPFDYSRALKDLNNAKRGSPIDFDRFCEIIYGTKPIKDSELDNILAKLKDPKLFAEAFALFDLDNSGRVDPHEIKATLDAVARALANRNNENAKGPSGPKPLAWNYMEVDARLRHAGRGTDMNKVQFKELLHPSAITDSKLQDTMDELELCLSNIKKAKRAFELVDLDKSGSIDNFELRVCLKTLVQMAAKKMSGIKKTGISTGIKPLSFPNKRIQENLAKKMLEGPLDFSEFTYTIYVEPYETEQDRKGNSNGQRELLPMDKHLLQQQKAARD